MEYFKCKFFQSESKARTCAKKMNGTLYHWSPKSKTKIEYEMEVREKELGYFDEEFASSFPWCVSWLDMEKLPLK